MGDVRKYAVQGVRDSEQLRRAHLLDHMAENAAYRHALAARGGEDPEGALLAVFRQRYAAYRDAWRGQPRAAMERGLRHDAFRAAGFAPLCVDIETAAICDLACPFCYRQSVPTPDRVMPLALFRRIIAQCAELGVPSIKLNWRGEPLLHPRLPEMVAMAKQAGILETIVNTNAVTLDRRKAAALVDAGLDMIIYSFDGGSRKTYEEMRPGRFRANSFDRVYRHIRQLAEIKKERGRSLPFTKIQMILTAETFTEQESFHELFADCVDDVSVKAYSERGGSIEDLDTDTRQRLAALVAAGAVAADAPYWRDPDGRLFVARGRLPCEQLFQRLLVTWDGRVCMCCYDWETSSPVGYLDVRAWERGDRDTQAVIDRIRTGRRGYRRMTGAALPPRYLDPPQRITTLREIWYGEPLNDIRRQHIEGHIDENPLCRNCTFKETFDWIEISS
ncbi:MAG: radical SAM protein [Deltaproteobacteria bacterium]|nr:radical SAM protein [Candidatus Anaeroferrophillacea bacterium]